MYIPTIVMKERKHGVTQLLLANRYHGVVLELLSIRSLIVTLFITRKLFMSGFQSYTRCTDMFSAMNVLVSQS